MDLKKLMFWKKDDLGLDLDTPIGAPTSNDPMLKINDPNQGSQQVFGAQPEYGFPKTEAGRGDSSFGMSRDFELLSSKLDAIKAMTESINQRLANIERIAYAEQQQVTDMRRQYYKEMPPRSY
ncbi:MAG: hypothetical protein ABIG95_02210 [Candidatus Woesearchaeota archaeon]